MSRDPNPLFVAKQTYHGRRMADAGRVLPIFGAGLFLVPLLWKPAGAETGVGTVHVMLYVFLAWVFLIGAAAILARRIPNRELTSSENEPD